MGLANEFSSLLELSADERASRISQITQTDPALADRLRELLRSDERLQSSGIEEVLPEAVITKAIVGVTQENLALDRLQLVAPLGHGGMGEVWRAQRQIAGETQDIALKLLRTERANPALRERFATEQKLLLKLDHPNIARLLDTGIGADGRPWIAMELVDGEPVTHYCDRHQLTIEQRLALFKQVLDAIQYAHDHLIVHRDIKPDNVLVNAQGQVKLLDFGIAKAMDGDTDQTGTGQRFFSLYAAAPEQLIGGAVSVATDVYALGGLLYELLSGAPLLDERDRTPAQLQEFIVQITPPQPSSRADLMAAQNRSLPNDRELAASLRGDLDRIVLHALRKKPSERYISARQFQDDIDAHLDYRPVLAVGQSKTYQARKFLRRHWLLASISSAAILTLLGLTIMLALRSNQLVKARDRAVAETQRAESARRESDGVNQFLIDTFQRADPMGKGGNGSALGKVVDAAFAELQNNQQLKQPSMLLALAQASIGLGNTKQAKALSVSVEALPNVLPEHRVQLANLGAQIATVEMDNVALEASIAKLKSMQNQPGFIVDAARINALEASLAARRRDYVTAEKLTRIQPLPSGLVALRVQMLIELERIDEAGNVARKALVDNLDDPKLRPVLLSNLGYIAEMSGKPVDAMKQYDAALKAGIELFGEDNPRLLSYRNDVSLTRLNLGDFAIAKNEFQIIIKSLEKMAAADDPRLISMYYNLAFCDAKLGTLDSQGVRRLERLMVEGDPSMQELAALSLVRNDYLRNRLRNARQRLDAYENAHPDLASKTYGQLWIGIVRKTPKDLANNPQWLNVAREGVKNDPVLRQRLASLLGQP
jgi:eukaryotic-like serine/threonine-protein kinase